MLVLIKKGKTLVKPVVGEIRSRVLSNSHTFPYKPHFFFLEQNLIKTVGHLISGIGSRVSGEINMLPSQKTRQCTVSEPEGASR